MVILDSSAPRVRIGLKVPTGRSAPLTAARMLRNGLFAERGAKAEANAA